MGIDNGDISPYVSDLNIEAFIADWREFYSQVHSIKADPSSLVGCLPMVTRGFNWGVWVLQGITYEKAYEMAASIFPCYKWCGDQGLSWVISHAEARIATRRQYVVWCRDRVEADYEHKYTSALEIAARQINTLTLTEVELLHQWFYWKSGGKNLDVKGLTRCDGSRCYDGFIPTVSYNSESGMNIYQCGPNESFAGLSSRQAVS